MKRTAAYFTIVTILSAGFAVSAGAQMLSESKKKEQNDIFKRWWGQELEWKFSELPKKGMVPKYRIPYAGHIYPDNQGGCTYALNKYDRAFNGWGRNSAAAFERHDIEVTKEDTRGRGGLFGLRIVNRRETPDWAGHCNGWTAAAIRHAEPARSVTRNGVTFSPSDIKSLLSELYVYSGTELLGGQDSQAVNPALLHVILANWLGRGSHPLGMDTTMGKEVWNYPIYAYTSTNARRSDRVVEVKANLGYVYMLNYEVDAAPRNFRFKYFHYMLNLDSDGNIIGGNYYGDSSRIDLLCVPTRPTQGGTTGNERGNPYMDVDTVLAIWRESAPKEVREKWYNIDPTDEDRIGGPEDDALDREGAGESEGNSEGTPDAPEAPAAGRVAANAEAEVTDAEVTDAATAETSETSETSAETSDSDDVAESDGVTENDEPELEEPLSDAEEMLLESE